MSKTRAYGSDAQLLAAFETTYGTAPDGTEGGVYRRLSFRESSLGAERALGYDPLLGQGRNAQDPYYEAVSDEGSFGIPLDLRGVGFWLSGIFGAPQTTKSKRNSKDIFTHVFTSGGTLPSLTFDIGHTGLNTPRYYRHTGAKLDGLSFDMARTGPANASVDVIAKGEQVEITPADVNPATYALKRFSQGSGTIKVGGALLANVTGGRLSFSNNLEKVETIRDDGLIDGVDETEATAEGSVTVRFSTDTTLSAAIDTETPVSMEYAFRLPGSEQYALTFFLPRVFLPKKKHEISGPGGLQATYDWRAAFDPTENCLIRVTVTNDMHTYLR